MPNLFESEELTVESEMKKCFLKQSDKTWCISAFKSKGKYWFFAEELVRAFKISNVMILRKYAGKDNADLKRIKLASDPLPIEYPLKNEEGLLELIAYVNKQHRFTCDFSEANTIVERQTRQQLFEEYLKNVEEKYDLDPSGDEDSDSEDSDYEDDIICQCEEKLDTVKERVDEMMRMLKPIKEDDENDDEDKGRIRVEQ